MGRRQKSRSKKYPRNQSNSDVQKESVAKKEAIEEKEKKVVPTSKSSSQSKEVQASGSILKELLTMPLASNSASSSSSKQAPLAESVALKSQPGASGALKEKNTHTPVPSTSTNRRAKKYYYRRARNMSVISDDLQPFKEKGVAEQGQGKLERNGLPEKAKPPTIQDVAASGLDNTCEAPDCTSNKPSISKDQTTTDEQFTTDDNEIPLSSDIDAILSNSFISRLSLDELMYVYDVDASDNFDDLKI